MTDGLKDEHRAAIIAEIAANERVEQAVLFGSRATATNTVSSDVDIALFGNRLTLTDQARLAAALDEIPMAQSVDLLLYDSIRDRTLLEHILNHGVQWYARANPPRRVPLRELCEAIVDCPHSTPAWTPDGVVVLRSKNIRDGRLDLSQSSYTSEQDYGQRTKRATPRAGDLVITREAPMGEVCMIPVGLRCCLGQRMVLLRPCLVATDPRYLLYALQSEPVQQEIRSHDGTGSTVSNLRISLLEDLRIPSHSLSAQRAIARILGTLDDRIELNRRMNATLEAMARALFRSWFVDFDPVRAKMEGRDTRLPKEIADLFPGRLVDSELGEVPEGWSVGVLDDAVELLNGGTPRTSVARFWNGEIPWYTAKDAPAPHDVFVVKTERTITQAGVDNSATRVLPSRTTVISARGTVGRLACLGRPMAMNQTCYGIRGARGYGDFFTYWLSRTAVEELRSRTHGTIFDTITRQTFTLVDLPLPPVSLADAFESTAMPLMQRILSNLRESSAVAGLRDALLPKLVSGELRVTGLEARSVHDDRPAPVEKPGA